jgi:hypothetical protein
MSCTSSPATCKSKEDETIDNFIVRLSKLSVSCEYTVDQKENMIRDQVVDGCKSTELRRKLLAVENLTLDKVRKIAMIASFLPLNVKISWSLSSSKYWFNEFTFPL